MSYMIGADGEVKYTCKGCGKAKTTRTLKSLPRGWCVTGILAIKPDPEFEAERDPERLGVLAQERIASVGGMVGAHFCSFKEGLDYLSRKEVVDEVMAAGVTLALWGKCQIVVDGAGIDRPVPEGSYRKGELPPPAEVKEGGSPF